VDSWNDARLRELEIMEEYDFLTMLQAGNPAPQGGHDD
jgi:hypothetical protein